MTVQRRHAFLLMAVAVVGVPLVACDDGSSGPTTEAPPAATTPNPDPTTGPTTTPTTPTPTTTTTAPLPPRLVDGVVNPVRPAFQTKSSVQVRKSVIGCFGGNSTKIEAGMIVGGTPVGGVTPFLAAGTFSPGQDIVTAQAGLFDGDPDALKVGVRGDQLTLEYLTALRNTANVVGWRCVNNMVDDPSLCQCDTDAKAEAMLARCIGDVVSPSNVKWAPLATDLKNMCTPTPPNVNTSGRGVAVASLVSSLTFAKLP